MKKAGILVLLVVLAIVASACDRSSDDDATTTTATVRVDDETTTTSVVPEPTDLQTDYGVDLESGTITVGQVADLSGPFAQVVEPMIAGQRSYWAWLNANGGIGGLEVVMETRDTAYEIEQHIAAYEELHDRVVAISHTTGSSQTLAIADALEADRMMAVPSSRYSGWTDKAIAPTVLHVGTSYCLEAMSLLDWMLAEEVAEGNDSPSLAVASIPGEFGRDAMAGALKWAEANAIEVAYNGTAMISPEEDPGPVSDAIVASDADLVYVATTPDTFSKIYRGALAEDFEARWSGAGPTYDPAFLTSRFAESIERDWYGSSSMQLWGESSPGMALTMELAATSEADMPANDYFGAGVVEAILVHTALVKAYETGDMTRAGVLAAIRSLDGVKFLGMTPPEDYTGSTSSQVQRAITLWRPSVASLEEGGFGSSIVDTGFVGTTAESYEFTEACSKPISEPEDRPPSAVSD